MEGVAGSLREGFPSLVSSSYSWTYRRALSRLHAVRPTACAAYSPERISADDQQDHVGGIRSGFVWRWRFQRV